LRCELIGVETVHRVAQGEYRLFYRGLCQPIIKEFVPSLEPPFLAQTTRVG